MIPTSIFITLVAAASVLAVPVVKVQQKRSAPTDIEILQYALTLEYLEDSFCESDLFSPFTLLSDALFISPRLGCPRAV